MGEYAKLCGKINLTAVCILDADHVGHHGYVDRHLARRTASTVKESLEVAAPPAGEPRAWKDVQGEGFWCTQAPHYDKDVAAKMLFSPAFDWGLPGACVECWEAGRRIMDDPDPADPTGAEPVKPPEALTFAEAMALDPSKVECKLHGEWVTVESRSGIWTLDGFRRAQFRIARPTADPTGAKPGTGKL